MQDRKRLCTLQVDAVGRRLRAFATLAADVFGARVTSQDQPREFTTMTQATDQQGLALGPVFIRGHQGAPVGPGRTPSHVTFSRVCPHS